MLIDVAFGLHGQRIPLDHGYLLYAALSKICPYLHEATSIGIHPVFGRRDGADTLELIDKSRLKLRVATDALPNLMVLAGKTIRVGENAVLLGVPTLFPVAPAGSLQARLVTIKDEKLLAEDESAKVAMAAAISKQLSSPAFTIDLERVKVEIGKRRILKIAKRKVVGYSVRLDGLNEDESMTIQKLGIGGRRKMGCGIFFPLKTRS